MNEKELEALLEPCPVFLATGNTYPHRETLQSWGWFWDQHRKAWVCEGERDATDMRVRAIKALPGVEVSIEEAR